MDDLGELALMYLDEVDPASVWGVDLTDVVDAFRAGGFTRAEAGVVARWLFACLPAYPVDGKAHVWQPAEVDLEPSRRLEEVRRPTVH